MTLFLFIYVSHRWNILIKYSDRRVFVIITIIITTIYQLPTIRLKMCRVFYRNHFQSSILLPSFYMENETTEGHKVINKGESHDSNSSLAYFGARAFL